MHLSKEQLHVIWVLAEREFEYSIITAIILRLIAGMVELDDVISSNYVSQIVKVILKNLKEGDRTLVKLNAVVTVEEWTWESYEYVNW